MQQLSSIYTLGSTTLQRRHVVPRKEMENTQPVRVRIANTDLARIDEIYKYIGVHGNISEVIRKGARLQIFIEEVTRERVDTTDDVRTAIHTLQVALDRRDRDAHDQSKIAEKSSSTTQTKTANRNSKTASSKSNISRKRKSKKVEKTSAIGS